MRNAVSAFHLDHCVVQSSSAPFLMLQAYYVIKAAQEREELQREGDILDGRIQTAEREVRGLEATLAKLNLVNSDMGKSFRYYSPCSARRRWHLGFQSSHELTLRKLLWNHGQACTSQSTTVKHSLNPLVCAALYLQKPEHRTQVG